MSTRRSTRIARSPAAVPQEVNEQHEETDKQFTFDNVTYYSTYSEMVSAKRQRNQDMLLSSGLLDAKAAVEATIADQRASTASARGIKRRTSTANNIKDLPRRKSGRLAGQSAPDLYVENESGGRITAHGFADAEDVVEYEPEHYKGRVNDGSPLSVEEAVLKCEKRWVSDDGSTVHAANQFVGTLQNVVNEFGGSKRNASPTTVTHNLQKDVDALSLDDESNVAKVVPDRIYSVVCHPSSQHLMVCAGDKGGYLGIWNVDQYNTERSESTKKGKISTTDGVHLFKPHSRPISTLAWNPSGSKLLSCSYDGTVRSFDVEKQVFNEVFATYDDDEMFKGKIGYGLDNGYKSWVQCMVRAFYLYLN